MTSPRLALALLVMIPSVAFAQEAGTEREFSPHVAAGATVGVATPLGELGAELEAHLAPWLSLSAGVGIGAEGPQLATMARGRVAVSDRAQLYLGLGASEGRYQWTELTFDEPAKKAWNRAYWFNVEMGLERRIGDASTFRFYGGIGKVLNDGEFMCVSDDLDHCMNDHQGDGASQKYLGLAFTRSFSTR